MFLVVIRFFVSPVYPDSHPVRIKYTPGLLLGGSFGLFLLVNIGLRLLGDLNDILHPTF